MSSLCGDRRPAHKYGRSCFFFRVVYTFQGGVFPLFYLSFDFFMASRQDNLIILTSTEAPKHKIYAYKNVKKLRQHKLEVRKFNPLAKKHMLYRETKK